MSRRAVSLTCFAFALISLSACSFSASTSAVRIGSDEIGVNEFERTVQQLAEVGQLELDNGRISGDTTRSVLGALLRGKATTQLLALYGQSVTDADRTAVLNQLGQDSQSAQLSQELKDLIVDLNSGDLALRRITIPSADDLVKMYATRPARLGVMCMRHILVKDEPAANKVLALLSSGSDFATLAGTYSTEPGANTSGGILGDNNSECLALSVIQSQFDTGFTAGALQAKTGAAYGPVKSNFGWHIILIRPFAEIADSLDALLAPDPGHTLLTGYLATAPISVKSSYGRWDPLTGEIIAN
ncbi:MAG: peptidylprolyl isomerase [Ilumatobacteraceae bacterium]